MNALEINPTEYHSKLTCKRDDLFAEDSYLSKSVLWELNSSNLYQWRYYPKSFAGSDAADWGSIVDCLVTTPHELEEIAQLHNYKDFRTKEAREFRAEAKMAGKILLHVNTLEEAKKAALRINKHKEAARLLKESSNQVVLFGKSNGIQMKALVDVVPDGPFLCDLKTTGKWTAREMSRTIQNLGYHVQAAIYLHLWNNANPDDIRKRFRFIWQQNVAPYEVAVTELPTADIAAGMDWAAHHIEMLAKAAESNYWPGIFGDKVPLLGRPTGAIFQDEEDMEPIQTAPNP